MRWTKFMCFCLTGLASMLPGLAGAQEEQPAFAAVTPEEQTAEWAKPWWMPRHEEKLAEKAKVERVDLVWIGDSITHGWEGEGKEIWKQRYASRNSLNLGFSGDRTENVLWRLQHGAIDGISPKVVVVMIGTNNTGHRQDPADQTAAGVAAILGELEQRVPDAKVLLLAIFPRGETAEDPLRKLNTEINAELAKLADGKRVHFLDINERFLEDGKLPTSIMPDLLHPNAEGYRIWGEAIEPQLAKLMGE